MLQKFNSLSASHTNRYNNNNKKELSLKLNKISN